MSTSSSDRPFFSFLREGNRRTRVRILLLVLLGLLLIFLPGVFSARSDGGEDSSLDAYRAQTEAEVAALCTSVEGVGRCRVMITFSEGERVTYRGSVRTGTTPPVVAGVSVVCDGADSVRVRSEVSALIAALFGIGENRIRVSKMS